MAYNILVINPGATSTKIGWFEDDKEIFTTNIMHSAQELDAIPTKKEKIEYRSEMVKKTLNEQGFDMSTLSAIACRGGTFGGLLGGAYIVDDFMVDVCLKPNQGHPANYAAVIGKEIADELGIKAYIYDGVGTNETDPIARMTGIKGIQRLNRTHALNTRAVCKAAARDLGMKYADGTFIAVHMGGGVSINIQSGGRIVDTIATDEGPMSTTRCGIIPGNTIVKMMQGKITNVATGEPFTVKEINELMGSKGGLVSLLGTNDVIEVEQRYFAGEQEVIDVVKFWAYQIAKYVGLMATVRCGKIDQIILTGGPAKSKMFTDLIRERIEWIAPVKVIGGALEMEALAEGILAVLNGEEEANVLTEAFD
ncbi:MAG: butyrate kinase [Mogibacterium sp.]|nr:butyrate kinase [Mogibacterium sp.]